MVHAPLGELAEGAEGCGRMAAVHGLRGGAPKVKLRRWIVPMTTRTRAPLCGDDSLLLEVADHSRRQADRLTGRADARKVVNIQIERIVGHDNNLPRL